MLLLFSFLLGFIPLLTDILIVLKLNGYLIPNAFMNLVHYVPSVAWAAGYDRWVWITIIAIIINLACMAMDALLLYGIIVKKAVFLMAWLVLHLIVFIVSMKLDSFQLFHD